jgi:hypothetical protein
VGHASIQITLDTYSHVAPGLQEAAAARFDEVFTTVSKNERGYKKGLLSVSFFEIWDLWKAWFCEFSFEKVEAIWIEPVTPVCKTDSIFIICQRKSD